MDTVAAQSSEHILVIDDDVELCNLVSRFLVRHRLSFRTNAVS
ncbi:MAG TPA: hypothetical protein VKB05_12000 [Pyrinomonadaceae bacterium]|nr:hypothetical protein [Pyrinomonadaceae bacterium]